MTRKRQLCPNCGAAVRVNPRYPDYLCEQCAGRASDEAGRRLVFFNEDFSGGCIGKFAETGEIYRSHICFVDGVKCWADEARFGGIVIRPASSGARPRDGNAVVTD